MKITSKVVALMVAVMLLIGCSIGGTVAWLATKTESVVNTFTVGNINIELKEHILDPKTGKWVKNIEKWWDDPEASTSEGNADIKLMPGRTIQKDPTVIVRKGSEKCYVRMYMIISWSDKADGEFSGDDAEGWLNIDNSIWVPSAEPYIDRTTGVAKVNIYEFCYNDIVDAGSEDKKLDALFDELTIPGELTGDQYEGLKNGKIMLIAQAVQAEGLSKEDALKEAGTPEIVKGYIERFYPDGRDLMPEPSQGN